jgi:hypothetical protein
MLSLRRHRLFRRTVRCLSVAVCLVAYLAAAIGFPVVVRANRDTPAASPGNTRACGCAPAQQCAGTCCCCRKAPVAEGPASSKQHSCCGKAKAQPTSRVGWVLGEQRLRCQGSSLAWLASGASTPPPPPVAVSPDRTPGLPVPCVSSVDGVNRAAPPSPPPRPS